MEEKEKQRGNQTDEERWRPWRYAYEQRGEAKHGEGVERRGLGRDTPQKLGH